MGSFLQNLFGKLWAKPAARTPALYLAAFGKHRGWNDHIDDLGFETERLVLAKRILYMQGIAANIDAGAWDSLAPAQSLPGFEHAFVWLLGDDTIAGRLWSSADGKGRTSYPMAVCAQCPHVPREWVIRELLPRLEGIEARCREARTAEEIRALLDRSREELRSLVAGAPPADRAPAGGPGPGAHVARAVVELAGCAAMGPGRDGLLRILYQIERDLAPYRPRSGSKGKPKNYPAGGPAPGRAHQFRVPACSDSLVESALSWSRFLADQFDPSVPVMLLLPQGEGWVDVIVGDDPRREEFYCIRATPRSLSLASDVPYTLDEAFVARTEAYLDRCRAAASTDPP